MNEDNDALLADYAEHLAAYPFFTRLSVAHYARRRGYDRHTEAAQHPRQVLFAAIHAKPRTA